MNNTIQNNPYAAASPIEQGNLSRLLENPDLSLEDRIALTLLESGKEFTKTVQSNLDNLQACVHSLASREHPAYFGTGANKDQSLLKVIGALRQYQRSKSAYDRLQQLCPNHLQHQIGNIAFLKNKDLLPSHVLEDISSINRIEKAAQNLGREFYQEKENAVYEAIFSEIPVEFLREVFKVGILTETSMLKKDNLLSLNYVFSKIEGPRKIDDVAKYFIPTITIDGESNSSHIQRPAIVIDLEEKIPSETEPLIGEDVNAPQEIAPIVQAEDVAVQDLYEDQNPIFMNYAEIAAEKTYRVKEVFTRIFTTYLQFDETRITCESVLETATNYFIDRCIIWICKD